MSQPRGASQRAMRFINSFLAFTGLVLNKEAYGTTDEVKLTYSLT